MWYGFFTPLLAKDVWYLAAPATGAEGASPSGGGAGSAASRTGAPGVAADAGSVASTVSRVRGRSLSAPRAPPSQATALGPCGGRTEREGRGRGRSMLPRM